MKPWVVEGGIYRFNGAKERFKVLKIIAEHYGALPPVVHAHCRPVRKDGQPMLRRYGWTGNLIKGSFTAP